MAYPSSGRFRDLSLPPGSQKPLGGYGMSLTPFTPSVGPGYPTRPVASTRTATTASEAYPGAIKQTGEDYDEIMDRFRNITGGQNPLSNSLINSYQNLVNTPIRSSGIDPEYTSLMNQYKSSMSGQGFTPMTAATHTYNEDPRVGNAIRNLEELSRSGGLSEDEQGALRARGVSPIRAVYANAQRNLDRQRALQGGFGPNYAAATSKMARELSEGVAGQTMNVNAEIAKMVQEGKLRTAPQLAEATAALNTLKNEIEGKNVAARNEAERFNREGQLKSNALRLEGLQGMGKLISDRLEREHGLTGLNANRQIQGLEGLTKLLGQDRDLRLDATKGMLATYGTRPGLAETFGGQLMDEKQAAQAAKNAKQQGQIALINAYTRR